MQDLRLLAIEQDFIVLEGANGEKFRLALDESLRKAIKGDKGLRIEADAISPREIQELVRSGHSIDDIVSKTSASYSYIEKFAAPVLEELQHIVSTAKSVRLSFVAERFGETNHVEFGTLIRERLDQWKADKVEWFAKRTETGGMQVSCRFELDDVATEAKWSFDIRHLSLSPENEVALNLASNPQQDALLPVIRAVTRPPKTSSESVVEKPSSKPEVEPATKTDIAPAAETPDAAKNLTMSLGETQEFAEVIPFGRGRNSTAQVPVIAAGTSAENQQDESLGELDEGANLLDSLRRQRDLRESRTGLAPVIEVASSQNDFESENQVELGVGIDTENDFDDNTVWIDADSEVFVDEEDLSQETPPQPAPTAQPASPASTKRGRAAMPSWDQIVFGTKPDSKDS